MVVSQSTSLTPAQHADNHIHGGSDPITGDIRTDEGFHRTAASDDLLHSNDTEKTSNATVAALIKETLNEKNHTGFLRTKFSIESSVGGSSVYAQIYLNDVAVGAAQGVNLATPTVFSEDIWVPAGAKIQIYAYSGGAGWDVEIKNFRIYGTSSHKNQLTSNDP